MKSSKLCAIGAALFVVGMSVPVAAQQGQSADFEIYEREVFNYSRSGRADPFRSLVRDGELGVRIEDLELRGVVFNSNPGSSVAVLTQKGSDRRIQARIGERVGSVRILSIGPESVEVVVEELGVARRETLRIVKPTNEEGTR